VSSAWAQLGSEKGCHMAGATAIALLGQPGEVLHSQKSQNYIIIYKYISINIIYIYNLEFGANEILNLKIY
jgi:hypothetical protein